MVKLKDHTGRWVVVFHTWTILLNTPGRKTSTKPSFLHVYIIFLTLTYSDHNILEVTRRQWAWGKGCYLGHRTGSNGSLSFRQFRFSFFFSTLIQIQSNYLFHSSNCSFFSLLLSPMTEKKFLKFHLRKPSYYAQSTASPKERKVMVGFLG